MSSALTPRGAASLPIPARRPVSPERFAEFLPDAEALAQRRHSPGAKWLTLTLSALVMAAILWSAVAEVDQVVAANGAVRPAGKVKLVNHPQGGRISAVLVAEGEHVRSGQPLVEIDPETLQSEVEKRLSDWQALAAASARLEGEAAGVVPSFPAVLAAARPDLLFAQTSLHEARTTAFAAERRSLEEIVRQREQEIQSAGSRASQAVASLEILKKQEAAVAKLADKGYFPQLRYLSLQREVTESEGLVAAARQDRAIAEASLAEARSRLEALERERRAKILAELAQVSADRDRAAESLAQAEAELRNRTVRAPAEGIVQDLAVAAPGQAVRANEEILKIVPATGGLLIEALVANVDIGQIRIGQKARVKLLAYDHIRYGTLDGSVERISADAVPDERGRLFYKLEIRIERDYLGAVPEELPLAPGMAAEIDLKIGERSILSYLTDRVLAVADGAFTER
ncbi:MAG TPA: HlyD family type I secretion periplasmic adaptor subunit [Alphaproteobacteria bacterium]|nr:HlyD family type I secretion periplasmic adaptor subunit [Alphaproteobacteria bacterium]